jgi:hypothetical protein
VGGAESRPVVSGLLNSIARLVLPLRAPPNLLPWMGNRMGNSPLQRLAVRSPSSSAARFDAFGRRIRRIARSRRTGTFQDPRLRTCRPFTSVTSMTGGLLGDPPRRTPVLEHRTPDMERAGPPFGVAARVIPRRACPSNYLPVQSPTASDSVCRRRSSRALAGGN